MSTNQSFDASGLQFAWDSTSIKLAEECLYKYHLRLLEGWRPLQESHHLRFGGVYAKALEHFHKYIAEGQEREDAIAAVVHEALIATWDYDAEGGAPWKSLDNLKNRENLIRTIIWYLEQFRDDTCSTIILADGSAAVEHSFKFDVDNGLVFSGHLDRLVDYGGKPYIQDQKTTGATITPNYFRRFDPDTQISGMYPFAGGIIFNMPIRGVMIDAAQVAVGFSRFERGFVFSSEDTLNEWYDDSMYHIEQARSATREQHFPKNRSSCHKYAGCEFRDICSKSPHVREAFLKGNFEKRETWDPLKVR